MNKQEVRNLYLKKFPTVKGKIMYAPVQHSISTSFHSANNISVFETNER